MGLLRRAADGSALIALALASCHKPTTTSSTDASAPVAITPTPSTSSTVAAVPSTSSSSETIARYSIEHRVFKQKSKSEDDASPGDCVVTIEYPEIVGLPDVAVTKKIDALFHPEKWDGDCVGPSTIDGSFVVGFQGDTVLSIETTEFANVFGTAHPSSDRRTFVIALATGKDIALDHVLTSKGMAKYKTLLLPQVKAEMKQLEPTTADADVDIVMEAFLGAYIVESKGIRFFPDLPQAFAAIGAEGFLLPYEKLAPYLSDKSEAREAWASRAPP